MRKPWNGKLSKFGRFCKENELSREKLAKDLDVTPSYISMLAHGKAKPGGALAVQIQKWTAKNVGEKSAFLPESWYA